MLFSHASSVYFPQVVSALEGSWIDGIMADGRVLWSHVMTPSSMASLPPHQLLPSDCTLRPDIAVRCPRMPRPLCVSASLGFYFRVAGAQGR